MPEPQSLYSSAPHIMLNLLADRSLPLDSTSESSNELGVILEREQPRNRSEANETPQAHTPTPQRDSATKRRLSSNARPSPLAPSKPSTLPTFQKLADCGITEHTWAMLRKNFHSGPTLAVALMKTMFSDDERLLNRNFNGTRGRPMIDSNGERKDAIRLFPNMTRSTISKAIDTSDRSFCRSRKEKA